MPKYLNWEDHRHEIYQRYITEDRALSEVIEIMEQEHGFKAGYVLIGISWLGTWKC
jgi:hypothetical protein